MGVNTKLSSVSQRGADKYSCRTFWVFNNLKMLINYCNNQMAVNIQILFKLDVFMLPDKQIN